MYRLFKWYFKNYPGVGMIVVGNVIDNPKFYSGQIIYTSKIEEISIDDNKKEFIFITHSGSCYVAKYHDIDIDAIEYIEEGFKKFNIAEENLEVFKNTYKEAKNKLKEYVSSILNPNELYIEMAGISALKAIFMTNERKLKEIPITRHVGMFQDSILITDLNEGNVDFRFFPTLYGMKVYSWNEELKAVKIYNFGDEITYCHGKEEIKIKRNELTEILNNLF